MGGGSVVCVCVCGELLGNAANGTDCLHLNVMADEGRGKGVKRERETRDVALGSGAGSCWRR